MVRRQQKVLERKNEAKTTAQAKIWLKKAQERWIHQKEIKASKIMCWRMKRTPNAKHHYFSICKFGTKNLTHL